MVYHLSEVELISGLESIQASPKDQGTLELIVIRPALNERKVLSECALSARLGVNGDDWADSCWKTLPDGSPDPDVQVTLMNSRCIELLAQDKSRWPLAGDQLYVDLDLSEDNLPVGQRLAVSSVILQITAIPHTGCGAFSERFGPAALKFVNSTIGKQLHLRGIYARVIQDGAVKQGDLIRKI
jgi:MOSC domain-containing protein YiiM